MNVTSIITKDYENKPRLRAPAKQTQFKAKQTQCLPAISVVGQRQKNAALHLFAVGCRTRIIMFFKSLFGKYQLIFAVLPDNIH